MSKEEVILIINTEIEEQYRKELIKKLNEKSDNEVKKITEGLTAEDVKKIIRSKIKKLEQKNQDSKFTQLNEIFSYGVTDDCVHMHIIPKDIHDIFGNGKNKTNMIRRWR